jgi:hypothetical protein
MRAEDKRKSRWLSGAIAASAPFAAILFYCASASRLNAAESIQYVPAPGASSEAAAAKGRKHPSYQVFAAQLKLPKLELVTTNSISLRNQARIAFAYPEGLKPEDKKLLSMELKLPASALEQIHRTLSAERALPEGRLLDEFKTAVIDYRYLESRWNMFTPIQLDQQQIKRHALDILRAGGIRQAWQMYEALPRPRAPGELKLSQTPSP